MPGAATTKRDVVRRVALSTAASIAVSMGLSVVFMSLFFGLDPTVTIPVSKLFWASTFMSVVAPALVCPLVMYRSALLFRDLQLAREALDHLARTDQLTGLPNRRGFDQAVSIALGEQSHRRGPVAALMCDIDYFKRINDGLGHDFGDAALRHVAKALRETMGNAIFGRQGGDEFAVLLPGVPHREALALAEKLRQFCSRDSVECNAAEARITLSIGLAAVQDFDGRPGSLISLADTALYDAKRNGRDRIAVAWTGGARSV